MRELKWFYVYILIYVFKRDGLILFVLLKIANYPRQHRCENVNIYNNHWKKQWTKMSIDQIDQAMRELKLFCVCILIYVFTRDGLILFVC